MKRRIFNSRILTVWLLFGFVLSANAQPHIVMPHNDGVANITLSPPAVCSYTFSDDNGGIGNVYSPSSGMGSVVTFWPSSPGNKVVVQFTSFHTESGFDALFVYDGADITAPQISSGAIEILGMPNPFSGGSGGWQGASAPYNVAPNTVRATAANASGALTFAFDSDLTVEKSGWTAIVSEIPGDVCSILAPGTLTVNAPAGICEANVQTAPPVITPGACSLALELHYRLNGGPAVAVPIPAPPVITLIGVPTGLNIVSWELTVSCGGGVATSAAQLITVKDQTPPTMVVPQDVTLSLDPGQCAVPYTYAVAAFDDCVFAAGHRVEHPIDFDNGAAGIMFDIENLSADPIVITEFGPVLEPGTWPMEIYITSSANTWQGSENISSAWGLAGKRQVTSTNTNEGTPLTDFKIVLAPGESRGVYLTSSVSAPVRCTGTGGGVQRQYDDGILGVSSAPGAAKGYPFGQTYTSRAYNGFVKYATTHLQPVQIAGLPSDTAFPVGITNNVFQCTDQAGNTTTASFSITVQSYSDATTTLVCANMVNASLGPECETTLQADDILLGGPYRCFDSYIVQIDKIPPFNDGPWLPADLNSADIGKSYGVRVTDPVNNNFCMGAVLVEDKIPPILVCKPIDLPCNFNTTPTISAPATMMREFSPASALPANLLDYQTLSFDIPASMPADAIVEDVDLYIRVEGDVFEKNLRIELESPSGTTVVLWNRATGCSGPLWVVFDDEGSDATACAQFTNNQRTQIPFGSNLLGDFDGTPVNGLWKLRVGDLNGFGDVITVKEVRLIVQYEASFSAGFPNGLQYPGQLTQITPTSFVAPAPLLDGCSDVTLSFSDETTSQPCSTGLTAIILRTWTARDAANNLATCTQVIRLLRPSLDDVMLPPDYNELDAPAFECGSPYPTPTWIESQGEQGAPYVFGRSSGCSINWSYTDVVVNVCPGSYTINRSWLIVDACSSQSKQATQMVKVLDSAGPTLHCPANQTATTDLYNCCATVNLPDMIVDDACSPAASLSGKLVVFNQYSGDTTQVINLNGTLSNFPGNDTADLDTMAVFGATPCLPLGAHHVYYRVEDACGNLKTCSYQLVVRDYTPPVAVGHSLTNVSLIGDDLQDCYEPSADGVHFAGVTAVAASVFDQGSYDNCNFTRVTVRRIPPYSACIAGLNDVNGGAPCQDAFPDLKSEYARATGESDSIKFYCCEAGTTQMLALRCYQLNGLGNYSMDANGVPIFNETLIQVAVQDKLNPGCQPPPDVTVSCENFDNTLSNYGLPELIDNCCLDTTKNYHNKPGLTHTADYSQFDSLCDRGTLLRTFKVYDCQGQTSVCTQKVMVTQNLDYAIRFPDDVVVTFCDSSGIYGRPIFYGQACELLAVSFTDVVYTVVADGCYEIERTWRVKDLCNNVPGAGCIVVPNPTPVANSNALENLIGPIVSPPGTAAPWDATIAKITPSDSQPTDYSTFWDAAVNCYEYKQIIKVIDKQEPVVENVSDTLVIMKDQTLNVGDLWNETYWYDDNIGSTNLGEGPSELAITATDLCSGTDINMRYLLFLDLDDDGDLETVVNSADLPGSNNVQFGNAQNPNYTGGESRAFDERVVPPNQKYGFALHTTISGTKKTATVCWNTQAQPDDYVMPELPYGKHKIRWIVSDGCGNEVFHEYAFEVKDSKPPTVVCFNGLSANIASNDLAAVWATDFLQYAEDNYTPPTSIAPMPNLLRFSIRKAGNGTGFPVDGLGNPITGVTFSCAELGDQPVEIWAMDLAGNASFCTTFINIQDNDGLCVPNDNLTVSGLLQTEAGDGLEDADVSLLGIPLVSAPLTLSTTTDAQGFYSFVKALPEGSDYTLTPEKDNDPLNGVSTYDLVLISKHILGLEPLSSPYKMIAADANKSGSITTFDIVEIRKLILGIYTEFPANTSWRFVDKDYVFPIVFNPFSAPFPETIAMEDVYTNQFANDFVAIKTGDVNGTALPNSLLSADDRTAGRLLFDIEDRQVRAGETFDVVFKAAEKALGYQFTLHLSGLEVTDIVETDKVKASNFGLFKKDGVLTVSLDGAEGFTVRFRGTKSGNLSEMLGVSSRITRAEAYLPAEAPNSAIKADVALRFHSTDGSISTVSGVGFELYQNQPNPFLRKTVIGFRLPEACEAQLRVFDVSGKMLTEKKAQYAAGRHEETFDLGGASGVLWYELVTPFGVLARKMVAAK